MPVVVDVVLAIVIIGVLYAVVAPLLGRRGAAEPPPPPVGGDGRTGEIESAEAYRNHLSMARWIELQLKDDLVRSSVPADEQARARRLLQEFYGEEV